MTNRKRKAAAFVALLCVCLWILTSGLCLAQQPKADWQAELRKNVGGKNFSAALAVVDRRLAEAPEDLEARGWRARLLAWSGRLPEAESEYRDVLEKVPGDVDLLLGLADVLVWQRRFEEALVLLDRARDLEPARAEVHTRRGRALRESSQVEEARVAYREALRRDPTSADAKAGLASLEPEPRHEFRISSDFDAFHFAEDAQSITASLRSRLSSRWTTSLGVNFQHRFGRRAGRFVGSASYHLTPNATLTAGGTAGRDQGVITRGEAFFAYGQGFRVSTQRAVRGLELEYRQTWLWFDQARVLVLTPSIVVYLPRDWYWSVSVSVARSRFPGTDAEWRPSGTARLAFPLHRRLSGNVFFGVGTENFAQADQVGRFSARTFGGGARWQFARNQDVAGYLFYQDRSEGRAQTGFGLSYAIRF